MSFTFAKELASKEADERMQELGVSPEERAVLYRMAYAVNQGMFMRSKGKYTTTPPMGTARLKEETFLSEYRISQARKGLRAKGLISWTVNRVPVAGKKKVGKNGKLTEVYEANEYTINRKELGIWWEPNKWAPQEEDDSKSESDSIPQPPAPASGAAPSPPPQRREILEKINQEDDAGKILAYCAAFCCQQQNITPAILEKQRSKIQTLLQTYSYVDIYAALREAVCRSHWVIKINSADKSPLGLMIACIPDMLKEWINRPKAEDEDDEAQEAFEAFEMEGDELFEVAEIE